MDTSDGRDARHRGRSKPGSAADAPFAEVPQRIFHRIKGTKGGFVQTHVHTENLFSIPWVFDHKMELLMEEAVNNFPD